MSGVTTSSLSLAWSLRNWVILDYEEPNGLTVRPWAPFLLITCRCSIVWPVILFSFVIHLFLAVIIHSITSPLIFWISWRLSYHLHFLILFPSKYYFFYYSSGNVIKHSFSWYHFLSLFLRDNNRHLSLDSQIPLLPLGFSPAITSRSLGQHFLTVITLSSY